MIAAADMLSLVAVLIPVASLVPLIALSLPAVHDGFTLRALRRPAVPPMDRALTDGGDERLAA
jgi:hypothetical protein